MISDKSPAGEVACAIDLGWRLAELYGAKGLAGPSFRENPGDLPAHLPGLGEMSPAEKAGALAAHIGADLAALEKATGKAMPSVEALCGALDREGHTRDEMRQAVHDLYLEVRRQLAACSPAAAVGFGLGRMLADTALLPTADRPELLDERFERYRLANAYDWLEDLDAALPSRAASAVRDSLRAWEAWVSSRRRGDGTVDPAKVDAMAIRRLRRQGDMWLRLLTGEKAGEQLLDGRAYVRAAASLLADARRLCFHYLFKWSWAVLLVLAAAAGAVWAAVTYAPAGTDRVAAVLVSAAGFLGISWTGIRATMGRALGQAERALWEAEVAAAIGRAATMTPKATEDRPEPPGADEAIGGAS